MHLDLYCKAMGIPQWKLRNLVPSATAQIYHLQSNTKSLLAAVVVEIHSTEQQTLFNNIVQALEAQAVAVNLTDLPKNSGLPILVFGDYLISQLDAIQRTQALILTSLQAMLEQPALKKEVWQKIRMLKSTSIN